MQTPKPDPNLNLAREHAAQRELGETAVTPAVARALIAAFAVTLAIVPALELALARGGEPGVGAAFRELVTWPLDGCFIQDVESRVEERSRVADRLRPQVQAGLTALFGLGNEQVYAGREGWLFQRAGFDHVTGPPFLAPSIQRRRVRDADPCERAPAPDPVPAIRLFNEDLAARGIGLVIVPTPVKGVVEGHQLGGEAGAIVRNGSTLPLFDRLRELGVAVLDPAEVLRERQERFPREGLYLATDTHWRPEAMEAVAQELSAILERDFALGPRTQTYTRRSLPVENRGDLAELLDLPAGNTRFPLESATIREVRTGDGGLWKPVRGAPVLLLGDSFSNIYSVREAFAGSEAGMPLDWGEAAGLAEQLSFHLARPVDRIARNAGGAQATRRDLARELGGGRDRLAGVRVVVWQFAVRELSQGDWQQLRLP